MTAALTLPSPTTTPETLDLDAWLAAVDAAMTIRLEDAALRLAVDSAYTEQPAALVDVVQAPVAMPTVTEPEYTTPIAALLQRAEQHMRTAGWCRDTIRDDAGAVCLLGSIEAVAPYGSLYRAAADVLLAAIRQEHPGAESVPSFNNSQTTPAVPLRALHAAAELAHTHRI